MWQTMSATPSTNFDPLQAMYGAPYIYEDICMIFPATLGDIAQIGVDEFYRLLQHITLHPPALSADLKKVTAYEFFLQQSENVEFMKTTRQAISLFLKEDCLIMGEAGIFALAGTPEQEKFQTITQEQFSDIQDIIRQQHWLEPIKAKAGKAEGAKAQEILDKLARSRQEVARLKGSGGGGDATLVDYIGSMAIAIPGLNILNIWDLTYYAFRDQFTRYQQKDEHDANVQTALAGGKVSKDKLKSWIRPIQK